MKFLDFQNQLAPFPVFSLKDVRKLAETFSYRQLDRWEKKDYIKKIKRGFYCFSGQKIHLDFLFYVANKIYSPSYLSLETALKYYGFIPEEVFQITSIGTRKTIHFETPLGHFAYKKIKPSLYFGYRLVPFGEQKMLIAEPEKAVLDYLYLHPSLKTAADFEAMRVNSDEFRANIDPEKFQKYLKIFHNKQLSRRATLFLNTIQNDQS